jgi:hypothetical protein
VSALIAGEEEMGSGVRRAAEATFFEVPGRAHGDVCDSFYQPFEAGFCD